MGAETAETSWSTAAGPIDLSGAPLIAAVVNATPDSFSDAAAERSADAAARVHEKLEAGADLIEVGGESNVSNRPAVSAEEEIERVLPVVEAAVEAGAIVSIDTYKPAVARAALGAGAVIVNDISGFADPAMPEVCASTGAGVVLMHTSTPPKQVRWDVGGYPDGVVTEVRRWFEIRMEELASAGVAPETVMLDPGLDFGKTPAQSTELLAGFAELATLGRPLYAAASRKDFVGAITQRRPRERLAGTLAAVGWAVAAGAKLIRAHDIAETRDYVEVLAALNGWREVDPELRIGEDIRREVQD
ncbi:MAG: dihydropteroate synthase [Solirubrobacterales bacterium]